MARIYLAGKADSDKWLTMGEVANVYGAMYPIPDKIKLVSSDHDDEDDNHGMGLGTELMRSEATEGIVNKAMRMIEESDYLVAFLDKPTAYGTVAEIAYSAFLKKPTYAVILRDNRDTKKGSRFPLKSNRARMHDAYWFISSLPGVTPIDCGSKGQAMHALNNVIRLESPIEHILVSKMYEHFYSTSPIASGLLTQFPIGKFRTDFAWPACSLAVELDGHDFHKTKEQRTYDAQRDRFFMAEGWKTVRFTGSEVFRNPLQALMEISQMIPKTEKAA